MTNGDPEGRIFLSNPHTNDESFFLITIKYRIVCLKRLPEVPEIAGDAMWYDGVTLK